MTLDEYDAFCASLIGTSRVVQWGDAHVWKVGDKVFAVGRANAHDEIAVSFKCSDIAFEMLSQEPGCRPAPYLASRGLKWIQRHSAESLDDDGLKAYLAESHRLIALKLTKAKRREFGLAG